MSQTFRRHGDAIRMELDPVEVDVLRRSCEALRDALLADGRGDPVIDRLLPRAVAGDDEADAELRALIRDDVLGVKLSGIEALSDLLDRGTPHRGRLRVDLDPDEALLVLGVLNDIRLAIGERVGVTREGFDRDALAPDDAASTPLLVMDHLAWLQEQLLAIIDPESVRHAEDDPRER